MKRFYIIFLSATVLSFVLLYFSIWLFLGAIAMIMLFLGYRSFTIKLEGMRTANEALEQQIEQLHAQLDHTIIIEQKTSKEVERVKQLKEKLLSVLGHEIRTPMNGIMGTTLLLADTEMNKEQREYTETIRQCGENLLATVNEILANDILDFSKLEQGKQLEYKEFDLPACLEEVLDMFAIKTAKSQVELVHYMERDVPAQIIGDRKRLRQVLMNLVENAVKFTSHGEIFVGVEFSNNDSGNYPELHFEIRDTGSGISENQIKYLFTGVPTKERNDNTTDKGLGLVICRKLVEWMGGSIEVKSEPGQGSTFTFHIPVVPSLKSTRHQSQNGVPNALEGKRILIADDNLLQRTILSRQMKAWKMQPLAADSGKHALDLLSKNDVDVLLIDINMPGMNGIELAKAAKEKHPSIPVILLNEAGEETYKQESAIAAFIMTKPVKQFLLKDNIIAALAGSVSGKQANADDMFSENFSKQYPLRILVAEDNLVNQKLAMKILTKLGYQPGLAKNGKEAIEMVSQEYYDIILMDVQMPEMDGLEATRMIRTCLEAQPVIIALTANVMMGDRDDCLQAGMDDYMSKPIELKELLIRLEKWHMSITEKKKNQV